MSNKPSFRISVAELAEFCCRRGDVRNMLQRSPTAQEGQQGQRQLQKAKPDHYQREVSVSCEWQEETFTCLLSGRIDGLQPDDIPLLEEIKTTYCDRQTLPKSQQAVHWAQLKLYGALYLQANPSLTHLQLHLIYLKLDDETTFQFEEITSRAALETFFQQCKSNYIRWLNLQCEHWQQRNDFLRNLVFPYDEFRSGQRTLSVQAYRDLRDGLRGIYQAATGLGKTTGILFPALKLQSENRFRQIWYLTAKNSGQRSVEQTLNLLQSGSENPLRVICLSARERICFCENTGNQLCQWQQGFYDKWQEIRFTLQAINNWDLNFIKHHAQLHGICPHQLALELLPWADLVIADYNYAFDPSVRLGDYLDREARHIALLVDEAHNLPERARVMFSARLDYQILTNAKNSIQNADLKRRIQRFLKHFPSQDTPPATTATPPEKLLRDSIALTEQWLEWFAQQTWLVYPQEQFEALMACVRFTQRLQQWQAEDQLIMHTNPGERYLEIFCTDPAPRLDELTARMHGVLVFSGSLQPLSFFARSISLEPFPSTLELPSPFPPQHQLTLIVPINTRYEHRVASVPQLADIINTVWHSKPGRYLVTFPSFQYLKATEQHLQAHFPDLPLMVQRQDIPADTTTWVDNLRQTSCIALVISGGSYAEGIDLPDNLLQGVIVVGTCMPPPSQQRELIQQQFDRAGLNGFDFAYRFPGLNRVIQSAGRVNRSETDTGVVVLVDDRFKRADNRAQFPGHWRPQVVNRPQDLSAPLLAFWEADL